MTEGRRGGGGGRGEVGAPGKFPALAKLCVQADCWVVQRKVREGRSVESTDIDASLFGFGFPFSSPSLKPKPSLLF